MTLYDAWPALRVRFGGIAAAALAACALTACSVGGNSLQPIDGKGATQAGSQPASSRLDGNASPLAKRAAAKVAMLLPLSAPGQLASIARSMKQAGELALFEQNNPEFQLIVKDDKGTAEGAKEAAEEALREGAEMILGPLLSASVQAIAPVAAAAGVPVIAFSNDRRIAGSGAFLLSFMPDQDVERIVTYAAGQGRRNFAALLPDDAFGRIAEAAFIKTVGQVQGNVITIERYPASGTGMLEATRRLAEAVALAPETTGTDGRNIAVFLPGTPETLISLGPLLAYAKLDPTRVKLLGSGGWDAPNIGRDPTFVGGWYPSPDQRGWQTFSEKFAQTYSTAAPRMASLAFDAVGIAATLAAGSPGQRFSAASITRANGFTGADGQIRFQSDGTAARALAVLEVQSFGANTIDPPATPSPANPSLRPVN